MLECPIASPGKCLSQFTWSPAVQPNFSHSAQTWPTYPPYSFLLLPRKNLCLLLWNIDLKKLLSSQIWPTVKGACFSVTHYSLLVLKCQEYPFPEILILHVPNPASWENHKGGWALTCPDYGNPFSNQLYPVHLCDLLRPWGHRKLQDGGAEFLLYYCLHQYQLLSTSGLQMDIHCLLSRRIREDKGWLSFYENFAT